MGTIDTIERITHEKKWSAQTLQFVENSIVRNDQCRNDMPNYLKMIFDSITPLAPQFVCVFLQATMWRSAVLNHTEPNEREFFSWKCPQQMMQT
jgi:hypothetical protein